MPAMATCSGSLSFFFLPKPGMLGMEGTLGTQLRDDSAACGRVGGLLLNAAYACTDAVHTYHA